MSDICNGYHCHCNCGRLHTEVFKYGQIVRKLALERARGNWNQGKYVSQICQHSVSIMARGLCDWCQDEVVYILHETRKVADHGYRMIAEKNSTVVDLTVGE